MPHFHGFHAGHYHAATHASNSVGIMHGAGGSFLSHVGHIMINSMIYHMMFRTLSRIPYPLVFLLVLAVIGIV